MQNKILVPRTEYPAFLERRLEEMAWQGRAGFSLKDLAEHAKLPITPNMRRRVKQLVQNGHLTQPVWSRGGRGIVNYYEFVPGLWSDRQ